MRTLIEYNGSKGSKDIVNGLRSAGIPANAEIVLIGLSAQEDREQIISKNLSGVRSEFPEASISFDLRNGSISDAIVAAASLNMPDLIIIEDHCRELVDGNTVLEPEAYTIISGSACDVRVGRRTRESNESETRLLVGYDGSHGSQNAINTILSRSWPSSTKVRLLAVADSSMIGYLGRFTPKMGDAAFEAKLAEQWAESLAATSLKKLLGAGLAAEVKVRFGNPKEEILTEAETWHADSIFVGQNRLPIDGSDEFCLGSVSAAVAARAKCSVEIVRPKAPILSAIDSP